MADTQLIIVAKLLLLLIVANGSPVVAKWIFGTRFSASLDAGYTFFDSRPILGGSKTFRGIIVALLATSVVGPLLQLEVLAGFIVGLFAMIGDLTSSFIKRRLNLPPGSQATGLDQIPESLIPTLAFSYLVPLSAIDIIVCATAFFACEALLSPLLHRLGVRDKPY